MPVKQEQEDALPGGPQNSLPVLIRESAKSKGPANSKSGQNRGARQGLFPGSEMKPQKIFQAAYTDHRSPYAQKPSAVHEKRQNFLSGAFPHIRNGS